MYACHYAIVCLNVDLLNFYAGPHLNRIKIGGPVTERDAEDQRKRKSNCYGYVIFDANQFYDCVLYRKKGYVIDTQILCPSTNIYGE